MGDSSEVIEKFLREHYDVTYPIFNLTDVNGPDEHPLFTFLKASWDGEVAQPHWHDDHVHERDIQWSFTKFLLKNGKVYKRYSFDYAIKHIEDDIITVLGLDEL